MKTVYERVISGEINNIPLAEVAGLLLNEQGFYDDSEVVKRLGGIDLILPCFALIAALSKRINELENRIQEIR